MSACSSAGAGATPSATALRCCGDACRTRLAIACLVPQVRVSVASDAGELREQPVQIDGDNALTLPVSIGLSTGTVRLLQPG